MTIPIVPSTGDVLTWASGGFPEWAAPGGGGATDPEIVRDTMAAAIVAGSGIAIVVDDPGNTITVSATVAAVSTAQSTVDFGAIPNDYVEVSVSAAWITASHRVMLMMRGGTADHPIADEDAAIEELHATLTAINVGVITIGVHAPNTTTGQYLVDILGAA